MCFDNEPFALVADGREWGSRRSDKCRQWSCLGSCFSLDRLPWFHKSVELLVWTVFSSWFLCLVEAIMFAAVNISSFIVVVLGMCWCNPTGIDGRRCFDTEFCDWNRRLLICEWIKPRTTQSAHFFSYSKLELRHQLQRGLENEYERLMSNIFLVILIDLDFNDCSMFPFASQSKQICPKCDDISNFTISVWNISSCSVMRQVIALPASQISHDPFSRIDVRVYWW